MICILEIKHLKKTAKDKINFIFMLWKMISEALSSDILFRAKSPDIVLSLGVC